MRVEGLGTGMGGAAVRDMVHIKKCMYLVPRRQGIWTPSNE